MQLLREEHKRHDVESVLYRAACDETQDQLESWLKETREAGKTTGYRSQHTVGLTLFCVGIANLTFVGRSSSVDANQLATATFASVREVAGKFPNATSSLFFLCCCSFARKTPKQTLLSTLCTARSLTSIWAVSLCPSVIWRGETNRNV